MDKAKIIKFHRGEVTEYFIKTKEDFVPLTDRIIAKYIPRYPDFSDKAKKREWRKWIKSGAEIVREAEVDSCLPNSRRKMRLGNGQKRRPTREDLAKGAGFLLEGTHLWTDLVSGYYILSTIVAGCHARALRQQFPSLCLMLSLRSDSTETEKILRHIVHAAVPRKKWKGDGCVVRRSPILKYPAFDNDPLTPTKLLSFSQITIRGVKKFPIPCAYEDTAALLIGAKSHQVREAEPYIQNAAAILLNCGRGDQSPLRLTSKNLEGYDPELLDQIAQNAPYIAAVLRWWWARYADKEESAWAQEMASRAKKVFPLADKRFVRLEVDPKELRPQLLYQVLGDFIDLRNRRISTERKPLGYSPPRPQFLIPWFSHVRPTSRKCSWMPCGSWLLNTLTPLSQMERAVSRARNFLELGAQSAMYVIWSWRRAPGPNSLQRQSSSWMEWRLATLLKALRGAVFFAL